MTAAPRLALDRGGTTRAPGSSWRSLPRPSGHAPGGRRVAPAGRRRRQRRAAAAAPAAGRAAGPPSSRAPAPGHPGCPCPRQTQRQPQQRGDGQTARGRRQARRGVRPATPTGGAPGQRGGPAGSDDPVAAGPEGRRPPRACRARWWTGQAPGPRRRAAPTRRPARAERSRSSVAGCPTGCRPAGRLPTVRRSRPPTTAPSDGGSTGPAQRCRRVARSRAEARASHASSSSSPSSAASTAARRTSTLGCPS